MNPYIKLTRPHHAVKNVLVFAALACSGQFFDPQKLIPGLLGFLAFCMTSSVVYIINDIRDREKDRLHPTKCQRPIASGAVSVRNGCILAGVLAVAAVVCNGLCFHPLASGLLAIYFLLNLGYSFGLKDVPIVDITILVSGFLLRILYGALVTQIVVSNWLYLTVLFLAFYFALGKRRNELRNQKGGKTRKVLEAYPIAFLDKGMTMSITLAIAFYALWSMDDTTVAAHGPNLVLTIPIVVLIILKYSLTIEGSSDGDPMEVLVHDKVLMALCLVYFAAMFAVLYL